MKEFQEIDRNLSFQSEQIENIAETLKFEEIFQFDMGTDLTKLPIELLNFSGVYFFEIQDSQCAKNIQLFLSDFKNKWEDNSYKGAFVPNTKQKRLNRQNSAMEWVPLYVGKSKNITGRLKGHFFMSLDQKTFGMKLSSRTNMSGYRIKLSVIKIEVNNYDLIIPKVESYFREKYNPIIGR